MNRQMMPATAKEMAEGMKMADFRTFSPGVRSASTAMARPDRAAMGGNTRIQPRLFLSTTSMFLSVKRWR